MVKFDKKTMQVMLFITGIVILLIILLQIVLNLGKGNVEGFELPFLQENEKTKELYGGLTTLPTRKCKGDNLLTASQFFANQYRNGIPLPFSTESEFERATRLTGFNIAEFEDLTTPVQALATRVVDPSQIGKLTVTEPVSPDSTVPPPAIPASAIPDLNRVNRGPDTVFESIPGPESERTIPPVQLPTQLPSVAQVAQRAQQFAQQLPEAVPANRLQVQRIVSLAVQAGEAGVSIQNALTSVQSQQFDTAAGSIQRAASLTRDIFDKLAGIKAELGLTNGNGGALNRLNSAFNQAMSLAQESVETTADAQNAVISLTSDNTVTDMATTIALAENTLSDANISTQALQNGINSVITAQTSSAATFVPPVNIPITTNTTEAALAAANAIADQAAVRANTNAIAANIANQVTNQLAAASNAQIANQVANQLANGNAVANANGNILPPSNVIIPNAVPNAVNVPNTVPNAPPNAVPNAPPNAVPNVPNAVTPPPISRPPPQTVPLPSRPLRFARGFF